MTWSEKLKDARWQRKVDEVLAFNNHTCETCERTPDTLPKGMLLHAHHIYYDKGRDPWDYPVTDFMCLCGDCHEETELAIIELRKAFGHLPYWEMNAFVDEFWKACHRADFAGELRGQRDAKEAVLWGIKANLPAWGASLADKTLAFAKQDIRSAIELVNEQIKSKGRLFSSLLGTIAIEAAYIDDKVVSLLFQFPTLFNSSDECREDAPAVVRSLLRIGLDELVPGLPLHFSTNPDIAWDVSDGTVICTKEAAA
jgi:hypothetical protein